jgi:hypothetical protein
MGKRLSRVVFDEGLERLLAIGWRRQLSSFRPMSRAYVQKGKFAGMFAIRPFLPAALSGRTREFSLELIPRKLRHLAGLFRELHGAVLTADGLLRA